MSNGRPFRIPRHTDPFVNIFGPRDGEQIPGGCDFCDSYQTVKPAGAGIWNITVHHDWWCAEHPALPTTERTP